MQTYIPQLLYDLEAAKEYERPTEPDYKILYPDHPAADPQYEGELDHIIAWEKGKRYSAEALFGIPHAAFPPAKQLVEGQIIDLNAAILSLWRFYRIELSYPENGNPTVLYNYLVQEWGEGKFPLMPENGICCKETCDYNPEVCIWGEACTCNTNW